MSSGTRQSIALARINEALIGVFDQADLEKAKNAIREALTATRTIRAGHDEKGHIIYEKLPDYPIRLAAGVKVIEWAVGKPVQSSIVANLNQPAAPTAAQQTKDLLDLMFSMPKESAEILMKLQAAAIRLKNGEVNVTPRLTEGENSTS